MTSRNTFKKGSCELLVLHILNNKGDCYGYEIGQIIRDITNEYLSFPEGSMYPVLYKLIDKGHILEMDLIMNMRQANQELLGG